MEPASSEVATFGVTLTELAAPAVTVTQGWAAKPARSLVIKGSIASTARRYWPVPPGATGQTPAWRKVYCEAKVLMPWSVTEEKATLGEVMIACWSASAPGVAEKFTVPW
jgi:hypothetical protein